jgi:hypothetical protein
MANTINQVDVLTVLHNQMGHRVAPGGTDEDLKRYVQEGFNYCWRYYKWTFSLKTATIAADGILPEDFDLDGYRVFNGVAEVNLEDTIAGASGSAIKWNDATSRYILEPAVACTLAYQKMPPTLGTDAAGAAPFPSAMVVAEAAVIYSKLADNPTRADITQEWDMLHSHLDRLVGRADTNKVRSPQNYLSVRGTFTGDVGN